MYNYLRVPILQYDLDGNFIREWNSVAEAQKYYGLLWPSSIIKCCNGKGKTAKNFKWKYKYDNRTN